MAAIHSDEFKRDAVRIALTSGLTRRQVASDLGVGHSTLGKWVRMFSEPRRVCRRLIWFSYAAMSSVSRAA